LVAGVTGLGVLDAGQRAAAARVVIVFVLLLVTGSAGIDLYLDLVRREALGPRIKRWGRDYPLVMAGLGFFFGMMIGHFFFSRDI
jgi:hypothetical protein